MPENEVVEVFQGVTELAFNGAMSELYLILGSILVALGLIFSAMITMLVLRWWHRG